MPSASTFARQGQSVKIDIRKVIKRPRLENIFVQDNDSIFIAEKPNIFQIVGEVSSPGFYKFSKGLRVSQVIKRAGGFTGALKSDIYYLSKWFIQEL